MQNTEAEYLNTNKSGGRTMNESESLTKREKILHLCEFSKGSCGVFNVAYNLAKEQVKRGHEVYIFSSRHIKGGGKGESGLAPKYEELDGIKIFRFDVRIKFGENALFWDFKDKFFEIKPEIVYCHCYRHPHCESGLKYGKEINSKVFLITHSPHVDRKLRGFKLHFLTKMYDFFFAVNLNKYSKVIATTTWEIPILKSLGCKEENIVHIPNGVDELFINSYNPTNKPSCGPNSIIFFGRNHPIKDIPTLERACARIGATFDLVDNIPMNNIEEKIKALNSHRIFVLPSKREAFPGALVEAMALGKLCISSRTQGAEMLIHDGNGFLFDVGDDKKLSQLILDCCGMDEEREMFLKDAAHNTVKELTWSKIVDKLEAIR